MNLKTNHCGDSWEQRNFHLFIYFFCTIAMFPRDLKIKYCLFTLSINDTHNTKIIKSITF